MFCNKCGQQLPDDAKFCASCGSMFAGAQGTKTSGAAKSNKKLLVILSSVFGGLFVVVLVLIIVALALKSNQTFNLSALFGESQQEKSTRQIVYDSVINEYEQALAWYNSVDYYHNTSYYYSGNLKDYLVAMKKSYSHFASFSHVAQRYLVSDVDGNEGDELVVMDRNGNVATYLFDEDNDSLSFYDPGNSKNSLTLNFIKSNDVEWIYFEPADMHVQLKGNIKITTAKERAADPNAKCLEFNHEYGLRDRTDILSSQYTPNYKYVIIQLEEQVEYPIKQLQSVFPHKIWSIFLAAEDTKYSGVSSLHKDDFETWTIYNGAYVTIDVDLTQCDAPSGLTGLGYDISYQSSSDCVIS